MTGIKEFLNLFVLQMGHLRCNRHQLKLKTPHNWYNVTGVVPYSFHHEKKKRKKKSTDSQQSQTDSKEMGEMATCLTETFTIIQGCSID